MPTNLVSLSDVEQELSEQKKVLGKYKDLLKEINEDDEEGREITINNLAWIEAKIKGLELMITEAENDERFKLTK